MPTGSFCRFTRKSISPISFIQSPSKFPHPFVIIYTDRTYMSAPKKTMLLPIPPIRSIIPLFKNHAPHNPILPSRDCPHHNRTQHGKEFFAVRRRRHCLPGFSVLRFRRSFSWQNADTQGEMGRDAHFSPMRQGCRLRTARSL